MLIEYHYINTLLFEVGIIKQVGIDFFQIFLGKVRHSSFPYLPAFYATKTLLMKSVGVSSNFPFNIKYQVDPTFITPKSSQNVAPYPQYLNNASITIGWSYLLSS